MEGSRARPLPAAGPNYQKGDNHRNHAQRNAMEAGYKGDDCQPVAQGVADKPDSNSPDYGARNIKKEKTQIGHSEETRERSRKDSQPGDEPSGEYSPVRVAEKKPLGLLIAQKPPEKAVAVAFEQWSPRKRPRR